MHVNGKNQKGQTRLKLYWPLCITGSLVRISIESVPYYFVISMLQASLRFQLYKQMEQQHTRTIILDRYVVLRRNN